MTGLHVRATFPSALGWSQATVFCCAQINIPFLLLIDCLSGGTDLSRTVMTFLDFPLSLEQSITRTWQSKPLCKMNLLHDIFISSDLCQVRRKKGKRRRICSGVEMARVSRSSSRLQHCLRNAFVHNNNWITELQTI